MPEAVKSTIYDYWDYKEYLSHLLSPTGAGRGLRTKLAQEIGVQSAFVSQVLKQKVHFSLEHAMKVSRFLRHSEAEARYFMLILEFARAGSEELRRFFQAQIEEVHTKRLQIEKRLDVKQSLSLENQLVYYSSWYYAAIHVLLSIPSLQTKEALGSYLRIDPSRISECLDFLCGCGLAEEKEGQFKIGNTRIHLPARSPLISKHHINWRVRTLEALEDLSPELTLFFSGAITLSKADVAKVHQVLLDAVERTEGIYRPSKEEVGYAINIDFYPLGRHA